MLTLVYFYNDLSGPCKLQESLINNIEFKFRSKLEVKKINVDENKQLAEKYNIKELPTIIIESNGNEEQRFSGLTQELFLRRAIESFLEN